MSISREKLTSSTTRDLIHSSSVARFDHLLRSTSALIQCALAHLSSFCNPTAALGSSKMEFCK